MGLITSAVAIAMLFSCSCVYAALPPLYETLKEFKSLIEDPRLENSFTSGEAIVKIERDEQGFIVSTNKRTIHVQVVYEPATMPGPEKYKLVF